mgnify:CR=1 FL=1
MAKKGPRKGKMKASPKAKTIADNRAITNPAMNKELKRLGITIQDLIDAEKKMKPSGDRYDTRFRKV